MKIILTSIGTRGDMEPFLAIGELLKEKGHNVICLFPEQFRVLAEDSGLEFESLGSKFIELLESNEGKVAMAGGRFGFKKMKAYAKLMSKQPAANKEMIQKQEVCIEQIKPDRIVHHAKAVYPILWSDAHKGKTTLISPVPDLHYVKGHSHIVFKKNYNEFVNKLTFKLADYSLVKSITYTQKWLKNTERKLTSEKVSQALSKNQVIYTLSPSLFTRPTYWSKNIHVLGFQERNKTKHWSPSIELEQFVQKHSKILFITFGSMVNDTPEAKTEILLKIIEKNNIPTIINTCAGGIVQPKNYNNPNVHFVKKIPYEWVFPKIYAVVHHGGSGTTHMAIKYGCANLILPHIIDQYFWNQLVFNKGVGPLGIDISKIKIKNLEPKILDLLSNTNYKNQALDLSKMMQKEDGREELCNVILGVPASEC